MSKRINTQSAYVNTLLRTSKKGPGEALVPALWGIGGMGKHWSVLQWGIGYGVWGGGGGVVRRGRGVLAGNDSLLTAFDSFWCLFDPALSDLRPNYRNTTTDLFFCAKL